MLIFNKTFVLKYIKSVWSNSRNTWFANSEVNIESENVGQNIFNGLKAV